MPEHTVRVGNVSLQATESDIQDFFSFSGEILHIELQREKDWSQVAYVTFKDAQALDTALLLSGAKIVDHPVTIIHMEGYVLPRSTPDEDEEDIMSRQHAVASLENSPEEVISNVLAKGLMLGKDAMSKAKQFDDKIAFTATATATASTLSSFDKKIGLTEKLSAGIGAGTSVVNQQLKAVDQRYQVSEKTKSAYAVAEEKVNNASSVFMKNRYVLTGAAWVSGAFSKVAKAAGDVSQKTREKVMSEAQRREQGYVHHDEHYNEPYVDGYSRVHMSEPAAVSLSSAADARYSSYGGYDASRRSYSSGQSGSDSSKPPPAQGLIL